MGTMTSYSSFNDAKKPIIGDGFKIAFTNAGISFIAGFACFSTVGYLIGAGSPVSDKVSSIGLAFVAYPAAIELMPGPNVWAFVLGVTLFTLGIDSSFSMLEATATVMADAPAFKEMPRKLLALILCVLGAISSIAFSFNWGFTYFDVVDHYLNVYLMLLIGVLETAGVGWVYEAEEICSKGRNMKYSVIVLTFGYWVTLAVMGPISFFVIPKDKIMLGPILFWVIFILFCAGSWFISGLPYGEWVSNVFFAGVRKLSRDMTRLSKEIGDATQYWWETPFEIWWNFCIKFWCPFAIYMLLMYSFKNDTENMYGGYHMFWQYMGFLYPLGGFIAFVIPLFTCTEADPDNPMEDEPYDGNDRIGTGIGMDEKAKLQRADEKAKQKEIEMQTNPDSTEAQKKLEE